MDLRTGGSRRSSCLGRRCVLSLGNFVGLLRSHAFHSALWAALVSGACSAVLRYADHDLGHNFLAAWAPDVSVFTAMLTLCSLIMAFRTSNALNRYTEAAMFLYRMQACWFDLASTLFAFCRAANAPMEKVREFQQLLVVLVSSMSAFCLDELQGTTHLGDKKGMLEVIDISDLDSESRVFIAASCCKVETVFQMTQQLVVDMQLSGVLSIPPPILTRAYQELGSGLLAFHEAKKLAFAPIPQAYVGITSAILLLQAVFMPFEMALPTRGVWSSFIYTFGGTFIFWYMDGVADSLDNPFDKKAMALDMRRVQIELNDHLCQLLSQAAAGTPHLVHGPSTDGCGSAAKGSEGSGLIVQAAEIAERPRRSSLVTEWLTTLDHPPSHGAPHASKQQNRECCKRVVAAMGAREDATPAISPIQKQTATSRLVPDESTFGGALGGDAVDSGGFDSAEVAPTSATGGNHARGELQRSDEGGSQERDTLPSLSSSSSPSRTLGSVAAAELDSAARPGLPGLDASIVGKELAPRSGVAAAQDSHTPHSHLLSEEKLGAMRI